MPTPRKSHNQHGDPVASCHSRCFLSWQSEPTLSNPAKSLPPWIAKPHVFASGLRAGASGFGTALDIAPGALPGTPRAERGQAQGAILAMRARDCSHCRNARSTCWRCTQGPGCVSTVVMPRPLSAVPPPALREPAAAWLGCGRSSPGVGSQPGSGGWCPAHCALHTHGS
jgi:hypothetical protein